jgi:ATP phosphoribosyltransferase regulatory subunit
VSAARDAELARLVESDGIRRVNPPLLLPAAPYFELAGEDFGRSLLLTHAGDGADYCLRPEFTLPIVSQYVRQGLVGRAAAYGYLGPVFRQSGDEPDQVIQAGLELLARPDPEQAFDDVLQFALRSLAVFGITAPRIRLGGIALFEALLANAELPAVWRPRIRARFGHPDALDRLLDRLAEAAQAPEGGQQHFNLLALTARVEEAMQSGGFDSDLGRSSQEIAARFIEKQALAAARIPVTTIALIRRYLAVEGDSDAALDEISTLAERDGLDLSAAITTVHRHFATLRRVVPSAELRFDAGFSPRLEYYTGVVFEMLGRNGAVLATGGQYDRLLQRVGASQPVTASGCAVWVDRLDEETAA